MDLPYPAVAGGVSGQTTRVNRPPFNSSHYDRLCRLGLAFGVVAGILVILPAFTGGVIATQFGAGVTFSSAVYLVLGGLAIVGFALCIVIPHAAARIVGIGLFQVAGAAVALTLMVGRLWDSFYYTGFVELGSSGILLYVALLALVIGLVLALVGAPRIGRSVAAGTSAGTSGYSVTALVLGICSFMVPLCASLAIAFAVAGMNDHRQSRGVRGGRGMAIAGLVLGIIVIAFAVGFGLIWGGFSDPTWVDPSEPIVDPGGSGRAT